MELMCPSELPAYFNYLSFIYEMTSINRQQLILTAAGGREFMKFINFEKISGSSELFNNKREKLTNAQKLVIDQFEWARGMYEIC